MTQMLMVVFFIGGIAIWYREYAYTQATKLKNENKALENAIDAIQDRQEIAKRTNKDIYAQAVKYAKR